MPVADVCFTPIFRRRLYVYYHFAMPPQLALHAADAMSIIFLCFADFRYIFAAMMRCCASGVSSSP